jgi:hypothetical protein
MMQPQLWDWTPPKPCAEELKRTFRYDPKTGCLFYLKNPRPNVNKDARASRLLKRGYLYVSFKNKKILAHRVIIAIVSGCWPSGQIDHINGDRTDNRYENLRVVEQWQNNANARVSSRNKSGHKGVSITKRGIISTITVRGKTIRLGSFQTVEAAAEAYKRASLQYFGEYSYFARAA